MSQLDALDLADVVGSAPGVLQSPETEGYSNASWGGYDGSLDMELARTCFYLIHLSKAVL